MSENRSGLTRQRLNRLFDGAVVEYLSQGPLVGFVERGLHVARTRPTLLVREIVGRLPQGGTLLDIGSGHGMIPRMVHRMGYRVVAIDAREISGDEPLAKLMALGIDGHFCTVGTDPLPVDDGSADVVFAGGVIEHLPHSPRPFIEDVTRALKPDGWLVLDTPNAVSLRTRLKMALGISNWPTLEGLYDAPLNVHHHKEYTRSELATLFELAGYTSVSVRCYEDLWYMSLKKLGALRQMGARPEEWSQFGRGFNPLHPYEYLRLSCLAMSTLVPSLRSSLVGVGRKPGPHEGGGDPVPQE